MYIYVYIHRENRGSELIVPRNTCTCWKYYNREGRSVCSFSKLFSFMPTLRRGREEEEGRRSLTRVSRNGREERAPSVHRSIVSRFVRCYDINSFSLLFLSFFSSRWRIAGMSFCFVSNSRESRTRVVDRLSECVEEKRRRGEGF